MFRLTDARRRVARACAFAAAHLLPARCFSCGDALPAAQDAGACAACWARLVPAAGSRCDLCAVPLPSPGRCGRCVVLPPPLDGTVAAFLYDDVAKGFLLRAKSGGRRELLAPFGRQLGAAIRAAGLAGTFDAVVTVAASPTSRLRRGFDPAGEIGRTVARVLDVPHERGRLSRRALAFRAVKGLRACDRRRALENAFAARPGDARRILLVDDVMTSGATAAACAAALRLSGARWVHAAVWARTPHPGSFDRPRRRHL